MRRRCACGVGDARPSGGGGYRCSRCSSPCRHRPRSRSRRRCRRPARERPAARSEADERRSRPAGCENNPGSRCHALRTGRERCARVGGQAMFLPGSSRPCCQQHEHAAGQPVLGGRRGSRPNYWSGDAGMSQSLRWGRLATMSRLSAAGDHRQSVHELHAIAAFHSGDLLAALAAAIKTDQARAQVEIEERNRSIADIQVRERTAQVAADAEPAIGCSSRRSLLGRCSTAFSRSRPRAGADEPRAG